MLHEMIHSGRVLQDLKGMFYGIFNYRHSGASST